MKIKSKEIHGVKIVQIISETKRPCGERPMHGFKRVMAIVRIHGVSYTRHGDTKDGQFLFMKGYRQFVKANA